MAHQCLKSRPRVACIPAPIPSTWGLIPYTTRGLPALLLACLDIGHAWTLLTEVSSPTCGPCVTATLSPTRGPHTLNVLQPRVGYTPYTPTGNAHETKEELFKAVRVESSKLAKASSGSLDEPTSSDPPGDWRVYFKMSGETVRAPRRKKTSDGPPGWDDRPATKRHSGTGRLPALSAEELHGMQREVTGQTGTDNDPVQDEVEPPDNQGLCVTHVDLEWDFDPELFEESSFMESPYGRKLLGQPVAVFVSEQFEPADTELCPIDCALLGPRMVLPQDNPDEPKGRPRKMCRPRPQNEQNWCTVNPNLRAVDGWMDGTVTGWHDVRDNTVVTHGDEPNEVMQGPAKRDSHGRPACYRVYHPWLGVSLWHNLDVKLYSLDPGAKVDHWRAFKFNMVTLRDPKDCLLLRALRRLGYDGLPPCRVGYVRSHWYRQSKEPADPDVPMEEISDNDSSIEEPLTGEDSPTEESSDNDSSIELLEERPPGTTFTY